MKQFPLYSLAEHLKLPGSFDEVIQGYRIDSRKVEKGDLFFALRGERTDGHEYLLEARSRGALAAVVDRNYSGPDFGLKLLRVADVKEALQSLARFSLELKRPFIVAITGSVGKTTTKEFVATLLGGKYTVSKTHGSYNTQLTLPLTILNREDAEVLVLEMGISEPGEMERLVSIAPPDIAAITKIALAHAAFFPEGLDEIKREKQQIFSQANTKVAILPSGIDLPFTHLKKVYFSEIEREADYFLSIADERGLIDEKGIRAHKFDLPFKETHLLHNLLAAIAVARQMHLSWEEIDAQIPKLKLPKMRFEKLEKGGALLINDAYNANPESMRAALANLPQPKEGGKRLAVLGEMRELGEFSKACHEELGYFALKHVDHVLTFGGDASLISTIFADAQKPAEHFLDKGKLSERLQELMRPGDVVLVKGSRSLGLEAVLNYLFER